MAENVRKVKILVLGDSGVGKSSLVHILCHNEVLSSPSWTVGCSVEVKLHEYTRSLSSSPTSFFVEFWDVGGSLSHERGRPIFYQQANGIVLVHDLTNRKSHSNLSLWLSEFYRSRDSSGKCERKNDRRSSSSAEYDPEQFADQELPLLIIGTKEDQVAGSGRRSPPASRVGGMVGATIITVDSTSPRNFSVDSTQCIEIMKFIDKVIEQKYFPSYGPTAGRVRPSLSKRHSLNFLSQEHIHS